MQEKMNVGIDQSWEQCRVAQVDDSGARRMIHGCAYCANAVTLDKDFAGLYKSARVNLEKAGGVKHNRRCCGGCCGDRWLLGLSRAGKGQSHRAPRRQRSPE
jgi:hypothetical protein